MLELVADPAFQTEMGQFNIEINVAPREIGGHGLVEFEEVVRSSLNAADERARAGGARMVMTGILPTLMPRHVSIEAMSANPRYALLNDQIFAARGEDMALSIHGVEQLHTYTDSITPESACTSFQLHLQVSPAEFAQYWNAAQAIVGVQLALAANSPFLFGTELWRETRIPLFEQVTDTRPEELKEQGVRPRVWFGERWITSVFDLFEENARYFPALLPICEDDDPVEQLGRGEMPPLAELSLHNGTIYRWNRPIYAVVDGTPAPARGEPGTARRADGRRRHGQRRLLLRSGARTRRPGTPDVVADVLLRGRGELPQRRPLRHRRHALLAGRWARCPPPSSCCAASCRWPTKVWTAWGVDPGVRDRLLGIIEGRCVSGINGATWQVRTLHELQRAGLDRITALHRMLRALRREHAHERTRAHLGALLVDQLLRPGVDPGQRVAEAVAPVLPVVAVAGLDEAHGHARRLEGRHHRAVGHDQRLVHAAADEQPVGHPARPFPVAVHEPHHRVERPARRRGRRRRCR